MRRTAPVILASCLALSACGGGSTAALPLPEVPQTSAHAAASAVLKALEQGNPAGFWAALPASWQKDINFLVRELGYKMDAGLYDEAAGLTRRLVAVLRRHKHYFLSSPMVQGQPQVQAAALQRNWDVVMDFFDAVLDSQLGSAKGLRAFDGGDFLCAAGPRLVDTFGAIAESQGEDLMANLAQVRVEPVKTDGAAQVLRFTAPGEQPEELRFIMVDGRWVPELLALQWDSEMEDAKRQLEQMPDLADPKLQMQFKMFLGMFTGVVERLEKVDSQEDFDRVFQGMSGMMGRPPR